MAGRRDAGSITEAITGLDVVISAVNTGHGIAETIDRAGDFMVGAHAMVDALVRHPGIRVIVLGGAGSLEVAPGDSSSTNPVSRKTCHAVSASPRSITTSCPRYETH